MNSMKKKILKTAGCLTSAEEFKFLEDSEMKTKSKLLTGAVAGLSFLALAATGALANFHCLEGTVVAAGSGYVYPYTIPTVAAGQRTVTLTCENPASLFSLDSDEVGGRAFLIKSTPDKDGLLATALTAVATGGKVEYWVSSTARSIRKSSTTYVRSYINVLNVKPAN